MAHIKRIDLISSKNVFELLPARIYKVKNTYGEDALLFVGEKECVSINISGDMAFCNKQWYLDNWSDFRDVTGKIIVKEEE